MFGTSHNSQTFQNMAEMVRDRANWRKFRITCFVNVSKKINKPKLAIISEMVRDRAKQIQIWDHMHSQWSQHILFLKLKKVQM